MKKLFVVLGIFCCLFSIGSNLGFCEETKIDKDLTSSKIGVLVNEKQYKTALKQCNDALKKYPEEYSLYYWRAAIYNATGNKKSALVDLNKAIELSPNNSKIYVMRGICKYNLRDEKGALADYNKAIELDKNNSSAYTMRAMIKLDNGDFDGANQDLDKANLLINAKENKSEKTEELKEQINSNP